MSKTVKKSKKNNKSEQETIEVLLGQEYGSDAIYGARGNVDPRRFTKINEAEAFSIAYFMEVPKHRGGRYMSSFINNFLNLKMGVEGWRANQGIRLVAGAKGAPSVDMRKRPGWIQRNVTKRDWKREAKAEGYEVDE